MPNDQQQPTFDVNAARQSGYSDDEILAHLTQTRNFDVDSALKSGYSKADVIQYLSSTPATQQSNVQRRASLGLPNNMSISAAPKSTGMLNDAENWLKDAASDMRNGTGSTVFGRMLQKMGAPGTSSGVSEGVGDFMGSPALGTLRAAQGATEIPQSGKRWQGTKNLVGGTLDALQLPAAFMGGPAVEGGAALAGRAGLKAFGSLEKAGELFDTVRAAAQDEPIQISDELYSALADIKKLADAGAKGTPRVATKLANRLSNVDQELYWDEARRFYSNISRLSANEYNSMAPQMQRAVGQLGRALGDVLQGTAESVGKGDEYAQAMSEYARSKAWQQFGSNAWNFAKQVAPYALGVGAGGRFALGALDRSGLSRP
jgi:hypothetical protein